MALDYTAAEIGGFSVSDYAAVPVNSTGTSSTTDNFMFENVAQSDELVITKFGTELSVTVGGDSSNVTDLSACEYSVGGETYLAVFFIDNGAFHYAVYDNELQVVEPETVLTSEFATLDNVRHIYTNSTGNFVVDASSTTNSSGNFTLDWQIANNAPTFLPDIAGESTTDQPHLVYAAAVGDDLDDNDLSITGTVTSDNGMAFSYTSGAMFVIYTGPVLGEGETANVTVDLALSDGIDTTNGNYEVVFEGTGSTNLTVTLAQIVGLVVGGIETLADLGGVITGLTVSLTEANVLAIEPSDFDYLVALGATTFDVTTDNVVFTVDQANTFAENGITFAGNDVVTITDSSEALAALTPAEIADLADLGVSSISSTDEVLTISKASYDAFSDAGIAFDGDDSLVIEQTGTAKKDKLTGTELTDSISGDDGDDAIKGGAGDDILRGQKGADVINGGDGDDQFVGGAGNDKMTGGAGADVFVFTNARGHDTIVDFQAKGEAHDRLDLSALTQFEDYGDVKSHLRQDGDNVILKIDAGNDVTLQDVNLKHITADDFVF